MVFLDNSCLADTAHWLSGCAQLLRENARLSVSIIIQIRTMKDGEVEMGDTMRKRNRDDDGTHPLCEMGDTMRKRKPIWRKEDSPHL